MHDPACVTSTHNLTAETCVLKLVEISLEKNSSCIAVRFDPTNHKLQVVDNGEGFTYNELKHLFGQKESLSAIQTLFNKIQRSSSAVVVTSRSKDSPHTYVKVVNESNKEKLFEGYHRPSKGTTVTVYNFNSSGWTWNGNVNYSLSYAIAAVACAESQVSFSVRNDAQKKMLLSLNKPHSPWEVLTFLKGYQINDTPHQSVSRAMSDLKNGETVKKISVLNVTRNNIATAHPENSLIGPFSTWSDWSYKPRQVGNNMLTIYSRNMQFLSSPKVNHRSMNAMKLSQLSFWSDWSYSPKNLKKTCQLIDDAFSIKSFDDSVFEEVLDQQCKNIESAYYDQLCKQRRLNKCRLTGETVNTVQVIRQVNKEFILATAYQDGKKLLIIIDQHAVHERIRYEWLLETYRNEKNYNYYPMKLKQDLAISKISHELLQNIAEHKLKFRKFGVNIKAIITSTATCIVDTVPACFATKIMNNYNRFNINKLILNVRELLVEIAGRLATAENAMLPLLPIVINNVIASEACHKAIKFGDPLKVEDCQLLVRTLQDTKAPTRCAHGRPSMVPLVDLTELEKTKTPIAVSKFINISQY
ncbi:hypothetical protein TKK_0008883 [Trichogramma kaykai]|uniref:MutL C-terminal dimerisation domain-containing protein n=1 Tax=Trichogramma kaykai TaxID=54128 RepID=A0ABD2X2M1_9HYME